MLLGPCGFIFSAVYYCFLLKMQLYYVLQYSVMKQDHHETGDIQ